MSNAVDQIEKLARGVMISRFVGDLRECRSLEDFERLRSKYEALSDEINRRYID